MKFSFSYYRYSTSVNRPSASAMIGIIFVPFIDNCLNSSAAIALWIIEMWTTLCFLGTANPNFTCWWKKIYTYCCWGAFGRKLFVLILWLWTLYTIAVVTSHCEVNIYVEWQCYYYCILNNIFLLHCSRCGPKWTGSREIWCSCKSYRYVVSFCMTLIYWLKTELCLSWFFVWEALTDTKVKLKNFIDTGIANTELWL